jgi:hypothetical protein
MINSQIAKLRLWKAMLFAGLFFIGAIAMAQDLEPRAYANLPKNVNAIAAVYGYSTGNILSDPAKPIAGAKMNVHTLGLGYVRTFGLLKKLARVQLILPYSSLAGKATVNGRDTGTVRNGFGDARIRVGINLIGSPALSPKEFRQYEQKTIVGVSVVASVPVGLYYPDKLINLGNNRWGIKPEIGISRRFKHVYAEAYAGVWFYTSNKSFYTNKVQTQEPVRSLQGHISYYFKNQMWIGFNANWFNGGKTYTDGVDSGDLQDNWRVGAIWSLPVAKQHSVKLQFHAGAFTSTGYDYNVVMLGYQYVFF